MIFYFEKIDWKLKGNFVSLKDWSYKVTEIKETRSLALNRYYWLIIDMITQEFFNYWYIQTKDFLHKQFKRCFLPRVRVKSDFSKSYVYQIWSSANLSNSEMVKYINNIKLVCEFWELGKIEWLEQIWWFIIPESEDKSLLNYIDNIWKK